MTTDGRLEPDPAVGPGPTLRDVPWRWGDVAVGLAPVIVGSLIGPSVLLGLPEWLWIPATALEQAWMFCFPIWVARRRAGFPSLPGFRRPLVEGPIALVAAPVFMIAGSALSFLVTAFLVRGESSNPFEGIAGSPDRHQGAGLAILAVGFAPFGEEMLFRGMLYNLLRRRMHFLIAALLSGIAFALYHPFGLVERLAISTIGVLLALLYEWRKTLVAPILVHAVVNAIGVSLLFYSIAVAAEAPVLGVRGVAREGGCLVTEVMPGGSAEAAGVLVGDVITGAGEDAVANLGDVVLVVRSKKVGDRIPVRFIRDGKARRVEAVLKARPR